MHLPFGGGARAGHGELKFPSRIAFVESSRACLAALLDAVALGATLPEALGSRRRRTSSRCRCRPPGRE
ncbi:hypothetical protein V2I01_19405 [Micromonospora sp. BRA006-A]|nr:hypothetical protein [Micromonospora sp. BRA006-A]